MLLKNKGVAAKWRAQHPEEITEFQEYENMFKELRSKLASNVSEFEGPFLLSTQQALTTQAKRRLVLELVLSSCQVGPTSIARLWHEINL